MNNNDNVLTSAVTVEVSWEQKNSTNDELYIAAFLLNEDGEVSEISDMVFYGTTELDGKKLKSEKHPITLDSAHRANRFLQSMTVKLGELSEDVKKIVFTVSAAIDKPICKFKGAKVIFKGCQNREQGCLTLENGNTDVLCASVADILRKNSRWQLIVGGEGYTGNLNLAYQVYVPSEIREREKVEEFPRPTISTGRGVMPKTGQRKTTRETPREKGAIKEPLVPMQPKPATTIAEPETDYAPMDTNLVRLGKKESAKTMGLMPKTNKKSSLSPRPRKNEEQPITPSAQPVTTKDKKQNTTTSKANRFAQRNKK